MRTPYFNAKVDGWGKREKVRTLIPPNPNLVDLLERQKLRMWDSAEPVTPADGEDHNIWLYVTDLIVMLPVH